jgi:hypothetical protein
MSLFSRGIQHPFYPALKPSPAARARCGCSALAGTFDELLRAADNGARVARAVFPLHRLSRPFLFAEERDALWTLFQVPVYAMLLDARGRVIGYECEVQHGFHLAPGHHRDVPSGTISTTLCECGRPGPRLLPEAEAQEDAEELYQGMA